MDVSQLLIEPEPKSHPVLLIDVDYERYEADDEEYAKIILYTRIDGVREIFEITGFMPYFYVDMERDYVPELVSQEPLLDSWLLSTTTEEKMIYDGGVKKNLIKFVGKQPWKVPQIRSILQKYSIPYYEADIPFTHRFMIDFQLKGMQYINLQTFEVLSGRYQPRVCSLDIEIDSDDYGSFEELIASADRRITAIGLAWGENSSKSFLLREDSDDAEIFMLTSCFRYLWKEVDPDILCTFNGDNFDFTYMKNRFQYLGISTTIISRYNNALFEPRFGNGWQSAGVLIYDLYKQTTWMYTADGRKTLDSVATELLGISKEEIELTHSQLWKQSLQSEQIYVQFEKYVERDALLTRQLWDAMNMNQWLEVIRICGGPPGDAMYFTERQAGEFLVFQTMFRENILIPPAPSSEEKTRRKKERKSAMGGYVFDPIRDLATAVLICDFASMYPTIIIAHNIGGESFDPEPHELADRFDDHPATPMKLMQEDLLSKRYQVKEQLKDADGKQKDQLKAYSWGLKIVANSTFGAYNFIGSRFYNTKLAGTITGLGRKYLQTIAQKVQDYNDQYQTIYGDTDSVFIETNLEAEVERIYNKKSTLQEELSSEIDHLLKFLHQFLPEKMNLELEDIAYRIIFHKGAKKRYAYVSAITQDIHIMGFEAIRNDFSPFAREIQEFAFDHLLRSGDLKVTKKKTIEFIQSLLKRPKKEIKESVITMGPLKRDPKLYKSMTPAVAAYLHYRQFDPDIESWKQIDFFPFIITTGTSAQKDRARHPDLVDFDQIDLDHYITEGLRSINRFNLGITLDEAKGIINHGLEDFFDAEQVS